MRHFYAHCVPARLVPQNVERSICSGPDPITMADVASVAPILAFIAIAMHSVARPSSCELNSLLNSHARRAVVGLTAFWKDRLNERSNDRSRLGLCSLELGAMPLPLASDQALAAQLGSQLDIQIKRAQLLLLAPKGY